jgi:hypothetical protein
MDDPAGDVITSDGKAELFNLFSGFLSTIKYWTESLSPSLNCARKAFFCPVLVKAALTANETVPSTNNGPFAALVSESDNATG